MQCLASKRWSCRNLLCLDEPSPVHQEVPKTWHLHRHVHWHLLHIHQVLLDIFAVHRRLCSFLFYPVFRQCKYLMTMSKCPMRKTGPYMCICIIMPINGACRSITQGYSTSSTFSHDIGFFKDPEIFPHDVHCLEFWLAKSQYDRMKANIFIRFSSLFVLFF